MHVILAYAVTLDEAAGRYHTGDDGARLAEADVEASRRAQHIV